MRFSILNGSWVTSTTKAKGGRVRVVRFQYPQRIVGDFNVQATGQLAFRQYVSVSSTDRG